MDLPRGTAAAALAIAVSVDAAGGAVRGKGDGVQV